MVGICLKRIEILLEISERDTDRAYKLTFKYIITSLEKDQKQTRHIVFLSVGI